MKSYLQQLCISVFIFALLACNKGPDVIPDPAAQTGQSDLVYYDYFSDTINFPYHNIDCQRVCYDINTEKVIWEKPNQKIMRMGFWGSGVPYGAEYTKNFINGNFIIRVLPSFALPMEPYSYSDGIYFQKINKQTGEQVVLKNLVTAAELKTDARFVISSVVSDGQKYFFACNNGSVYCCSANGDIVWKRDNYPMTNISGSTSHVSFIYYNDKRIQFFSSDKNLPLNVVCCLDAETGNVLWENWQSDPVPEPFIFTKDRFVNLNKDGVTAVYYNATGKESTFFPHAGSGAAHFMVRAIGKLTDSMVIYFNRDNNIGLINLEDPLRNNWLDIGAYGHKIDNNFIYDKHKIYTGFDSWGDQKVIFSCIDVTTMGAKFAWQQAFVFSGSILIFRLYHYFLKNNKIYMFTNFSVVNGKCILNATGGNVIILDAVNGNILKQTSGLPIGKNYSYGIYNVVSE